MSLTESVDQHYGEGLLTFFHDNIVVFKLYNLDGKFNSQVSEIIQMHSGSLS